MSDPSAQKRVDRILAFRSELRDLEAEGIDHSALTGTSRTYAVLALALAFSAVLFLIADLDRPHEGMIRVSQQVMIDLRNSLNAPGP